MDVRYVEYLESLAGEWSSCRASSLLGMELMEYMVPRFHRCSSPMKVRILLSILYLDDQKRLECQNLLLKLLAEAEVDKDDWVRKLSRLVATFVSDGAIDVRDTDSETAFQILKHIRTSLNNSVTHKAPLDAEDMVNVISENLQQDLLFGSLPDAAFGTVDFRPGLDLKKMAQDLCAQGHKLLIDAAERRQQHQPRH